MAFQEFGVIRDEEVLTPVKLGERIGRKERVIKELLKEYDIPFANINGLWQVSGLTWRLAMERIAMQQQGDQ